MTRWVGNNKLGEGRMEIVESRPAELVRFRLDFYKPFAATNSAEFTFKPHMGGTAVTWTMDGCRNFMMKGVGMFMDMDKMIGGQFDEGLAMLKSITEKRD